MTVNDVIESFPPISLAEMDGIRLMNRIDSKYLTDTAGIEKVLADALDAGYMVFETEGVRIHPYDSVYFDTPGLKAFTEHRRGKLTRQKVRTRVYKVSGDYFLEIKNKNNHSRTKKKRIAIPADCFHDFSGNAEVAEWMGKRFLYSPERLSASLGTAFNRITLVNAGKTERLTIDMDVRFTNYRNGVEAGLGRAVIIELKQDGRLGSPMRHILLENRIMPYRISKYCMGISMTTPGIPPGRFKAKVRQIEKINITC